MFDAPKDAPNICPECQLKEYEKLKNKGDDKRRKIQRSS